MPQDRKPKEDGNEASATVKDRGPAPKKPILEHISDNADNFTVAEKPSPVAADKDTGVTDESSFEVVKPHAEQAEQHLIADEILVIRERESEPSDSGRVESTDETLVVELIDEPQFTPKEDREPVNNGVVARQLDVEHMREADDALVSVVDTVAVEGSVAKKPDVPREVEKREDATKVAEGTATVLGTESQLSIDVLEIQDDEKNIVTTESPAIHVEDLAPDITAETVEVDGSQNPEFPEVLSELFALSEVQDDEASEDSIEMGIQEQELPVKAGEIAAEADHEFVTQIEAYIAQLEASEIVATDKQEVLASEADEAGVEDENVEKLLQPRQAFVEVLETAQRMQDLKVQIETIVAMEVNEANGEESSGPEQLTDLREQQEALEAELYEVCEQFLESIGVEPTEAKVQALVHRVLKINFEALEKEHQFNAEQLVDMGTHEYKIGNWLQKTKQALSFADVSLHQAIGIFATWHVATDHV